MKITVTSPCFQEIKFVKAWLENVLGWADAVVVSEGGSTDGTRDILSDYQRQNPDRITIFDDTQPSDPQCYGFHEGERRQKLAEAVKEGIQCLVDVDEMFPDNFREIVTECLPRRHIGGMTKMDFWRSPNYIRVGVPGDEHWGPIVKHCIFPANTMAWQPAPNHSTMLCALPMMPLKGTKYHFHYLYAQRKVFENRIAEFVGAEQAMATLEIRLKVVRIKLPKAFGLLEEHVRFADLCPE